MENVISGQTIRLRLFMEW